MGGWDAAHGRATAVDSDGARVGPGHVPCVGARGSHMCDVMLLMLLALLLSCAVFTAVQSSG